MQLSPTIPTAAPTRFSQAANVIDPSNPPAVPARWSRFWKSPIAAFDYGPGSRIAPWREAWIPSERTISGGRTPALVYGGTAASTAIQAAHALARTTVRVRVSDTGGQQRTVQLNPAMAVLHDARSGAYWITPLTSSARSGDDWVELPHSIDGDAYEGEQPFLRTARVAGASKDLVAVVGRDSVITPTKWADAPNDSKGRTTED